MLLNELSCDRVTDKKINLLLIFLLACKTLPDEYNNYGYLMMEHGRLQFRTCPEGTIYRHGLCGQFSD
jgi:hypothetical protein